MTTNTFTGLYPTIYQALDKVSREMVGFIPAVVKNADVTRAALGETIAWPVVTAGAVEDTTPGAYSPQAQATDGTPVTTSISKSKDYPFFLTGEETLGLRNGTSLQIIVQKQFEQAFRALCNLIEIDLWTVAYKASSRAYGSAGTAPFATAGDLSDLAFTLKILKDNGAPTSDLHLVLSTAAAASLRAKQSIQLAYAGAEMAAGQLNRGSLGELMGFSLHESAAAIALTKGTGAATYQINGGHAAAVKSLVLKTGSGTILAGDVITIGTDTNKYVVNSGITSPGTIKIGAPGLQILKSGNEYATVGDAYTPNMAFDGGALFLATRVPMAPEGGDAADDATIIQDPVSGLAFEIRTYPQYHQRRYEVGIAWGYKAVKSEHIATLLG
jgi:hypothetical protein